MLSAKASRNFVKLLSSCRSASTNLPKNDEISPIFTNRNPRNLEKMRIGYKPDGYHVENPGKCYWNKLNLVETGRYATASVVHHEKGEIFKVTTREWAIRTRLYKTKDTSAFINLGRVFAERCLQSGLTEIRCDIVPRNLDGKVAAFLKAVEEGGIRLQEAPQYKPPRSSDQFRPEKPWEITE